MRERRIGTDERWISGVMDLNESGIGCPDTADSTLSPLFSPAAAITILSDIRGPGVVFL